MHRPDCPCADCKLSRLSEWANSDDGMEMRITALNRKLDEVLEFHRPIWFRVDNLSDWMNEGYEVPD